MPGNTPPDLLSRARQILLPLVTTEDAREALLTEAFYLHDPLLYALDRRGAPYPFAVNCVKTLLDYGCLAECEHALARLLTVVRSLTGVNKHAEIDELIGASNALCQAADPPQRKSAPLVPAAKPAPLQTIATPRGERRPTVFLSYAHADKKFADRLIADLRAAGHACWIDTSDLKGGDEWIMTIAEGIINSYVMVVVVTQRALDSRWVQDEILWARQKNKPLIPVMRADLFGATRFFPLASYQAVNFFDREYAAALPELLRALPSPTLPESVGDDLPVTESAPELQPAVVPPSSPPHSTPRTLELAYLERLKLEELLNTEKYTPLGGLSQQQARRPEMRAVFELLPMGREQRAFQERRRFENAVAEIRRLRRAVLLGEPGAGKTTTIWKLAAELMADALADRAAPIPLLIRLGRWTEAEQPLPEFIAAQLGDLGAHLDVLLGERRAALLLDGLNELPASQHAAKYPQVQRFVEQQARQHPHLLAIVSCRELDYTLDLGFDQINITPLDPLRIREFVGRYLNTKTEPEKGEALFWKLAGQTAKETHKRFMQQLGDKLAEPERVFWLEAHVPEVASVWGWSKDNDWYWRQWLEDREKPSSLMVLARNPYMLLMLTSVYAEQGELPENRGELFQLFVQTLLQRERIPADEQTPLTEGLARVAYEMQIRRAPDPAGTAGDASPERLADDAGNALTVLPKAEVLALLGERLLYLAGSASILSVGEQVRFTHQLLQEYFAARYMDLEIRAGRLHATDIWPPQHWWQRTNWEEAAILLAGLYSDDCAPVVEWIAQANPEVAALCAARSGAALAASTREGWRAQWLPRLTDLQRSPTPAERAAIGRALGLTGLDNRKGVGVVCDAGGVALPDIDWVEIPSGEFQYGDKDESDSPPQRLTLPTFHISRYPMTYTQFQTFLDDPEGYANPQWFAGLVASDDDRRLEEQRFKFANHPREMVNWYQAMAFCRWFSWRLGGGYDLKKVDEWAVRLPTEFEWEKAARGTDGRLYPYGNEFDATKGNTYETLISQTSAVGIFPNGASPYGVEEMSGNVWEWCLSDYDQPQLDARKEKLGTENNRVLRGGSWFYGRSNARAACRSIDLPAVRDYYFGFRVVVVRPPS